MGLQDGVLLLFFIIWLNHIFRIFGTGVSRRRRNIRNNFRRVQLRGDTKEQSKTELSPEASQSQSLCKFTVQWKCRVRLSPLWKMLPLEIYNAQTRAAGVWWKRTKVFLRFLPLSSQTKGKFGGAYSQTSFATLRLPSRCWRKSWKSCQLKTQNEIIYLKKNINFVMFRR